MTILPGDRAPYIHELEQLRGALDRERELRQAAEERARTAERDRRAYAFRSLDQISRGRPLLLAWVDRECRFHFANERYAALFDQTPASIAGLTIREFYGEVIWSRIERHVSAALRGERVHFEVNDPTQADPCLFEVTYIPDTDHGGGVPGFYLVLHDVKQVRRAERSSAFLAEASHILAGTLDDQDVLDEIARLAVPRLADWCLVDFLDDEEGRLQRVAVGHPPDADPEIVRRHKRFYPPKDSAFTVVATARSGKPVVNNHVDDALLQSVARDEDHLQLLRAIGIRSFLSVPLSARGRTFGVITFIRTRGLFSDHDLDLATDLGRRVALAIDNNGLYAEAQQANRAKDDFLATLSHELRTPLTAILGWAATLQDEPADSRVLRDGLAIIERSARIQAQLVDDVLDVSRIISGKLLLDLHEADFAALVAAVVEQMTTVAEAKRITIEADGPRPLPIVADRMRLEQVVWNLLTNAVKFSPKGRTIRVRWSSGASIRLEVSDEGEGIAPEILPLIFERFRQGDSSITRRHGGLGLGLSIVRHLVEGHGGSVSATSAGIGQGATFRVELPPRGPQAGWKAAGEKTPKGLSRPRFNCE